MTTHKLPPLHEREHLPKDPLTGPAFSHSGHDLAKVLREIADRVDVDGIIWHSFEQSTPARKGMPERDKTDPLKYWATWEHTGECTLTISYHYRDLLICRVEEGEVYYDSHTGKWASDSEMQAIMDNWPYDIEPLLDEEPAAQAAIEASASDYLQVFLITLHSPSFNVDPGYWNMDHGYVPAEYCIECESVTVEEVT